MGGLLPRARHLPVPLRNVALTAMEIATLEPLFPGRLLAGRTGDYSRPLRHARGRRPGPPPVSTPGALAGATGPRSLRLTGECADGTILTGGTTPAGRTGRHPVTVYVIAATGDCAESRLAEEFGRWNLDPAGAGADTVVLQPTVEDPDPEGFLRFDAEEVRPLVPLA